MGASGVVVSMSMSAGGWLTAAGPGFGGRARCGLDFRAMIAGWPAWVAMDLAAALTRLASSPRPICIPTLTLLADGDQGP